MLTEKSAKYACTVRFGPHDVSCPPKNVEKNTPENAIPEMPVTFVAKTCLPSYQIVTVCFWRLTCCSTLCQRASAANFHFPSPRSLPNISGPTA